MCGKFSMMMTWGEYCARAGTGSDGGYRGGDAMDPGKMLATMTPMANIPVLHLGPVRQRRITPMRWGWPDLKSPDPTRKFKHLHARAETIDSAPTWSQAFQDTRGAILTMQFNIGEELPNGKAKQWICSREDGEPVWMAIIYSAWEFVQGPLRAFAMVTTDSCPPLNGRDNRMPAILADDDELAMWLGEVGGSDADLKALLRPYEGKLVMREQDLPKSKQDGPPRKPKKPDPQPGLF